MILDEEVVENTVETTFLTALAFSHFYLCLKKPKYEQQKNTIVTTLAQTLKTLEETKLNNMSQAG